MQKYLKLALRYVCYAVGALFAIVLALNVIFIVLLESTEREWLGSAADHPSLNVRLDSPHQITVLDIGYQSLHERLAIINKATKSIEMEFFIYELDSASRIITNALMQKASEGIKVRILVDFAAPVFQLGPYYAKKLQEKGILVKYYNTSEPSRFFAVQHRTHRKILTVDGVHAIIGGRNIANDYFDMAESYNFLDSDIHVEGPIVRSIIESFDLYWNSAWTSDTHEHQSEIDENEIKTSLELTKNDLAKIKRMETLAPSQEKFVCQDIQFVTDYPGSGVENRRVYETVVALTKESNSEIVLESPYFVLREDGLNDLKNTLKNNVNIKVLTNSLRSTDAFYVISALIPNLSNLEIPGFELYGYEGYAPTNQILPFTRPKIWGVHGKRAVLDKKTVAIGSYNIDPRSANFNSELLIICRNQPELANAVLDDIQSRIAVSGEIIGPNGEGLSALLTGASLGQITKTYLILPVAWLFDYLL